MWSTLIQHTLSSGCSFIQPCFHHSPIYITTNQSIALIIKVNIYPPSAAYIRQWIGPALVQIMAPRHYLKQCWMIVNWTLGNNLQWNLNQNTIFFIHENTFENVVREMVAIFPGRWVKSIINDGKNYMKLYFKPCFLYLTCTLHKVITHCCLVTLCRHIADVVTIVSNNALSSVWRHVVTSTSAECLLLGPWNNVQWNYYPDIVISYKKMYFYIFSAKQRPLCSSLNVSTPQTGY